ncbi:MAG: class III poly(R)-hydroxyalkanoic acid synthase subunit PhaE [Luteimonas sp.]
MASNTQWPGDFESLARQYWSAWGNTMRTGASPAAPHAGAQGFQQAVDWWSQLAHGGRGDVNDAVEKFNLQTRNWFGQMQQVAAQFAGQDASAGDISREWKKALGAVGENPFPDMFRSMRGQGQQGLEQWIEDASPYVDAWRREGMSMLRMPAFGFAREQQERSQSRQRAQVEYQEKTAAYNALMLKASQGAYELFESKLAEREEPGRQLTSARALFDVWIDSAEEAYAQIALSPEFRKVYGELVNSQMRMRVGVQQEVEQACAMFGMPTRTEIDSAHRKIAELERALRRLRDAAADASQVSAPRTSPTSSAPAKKVVKSAAPKATATIAKSDGRKAKIKKPGTSKAASRKPVAVKRAVNKPAVNKRAVNKGAVNKAAARRPATKTTAKRKR